MPRWPEKETPAKSLSTHSIWDGEPNKVRKRRPNKSMVLKAKPMKAKSLLKTILKRRIPDVDPRTQRMAYFAVTKAEAGKDVRIGITKQNNDFATISVKWLEESILFRPDWFFHQGVFLHRSGGKISLFTMREGVHQFRCYLDNKKALAEKEVITLFDPVELDEQTKELRAELHRWDD